eukprot:GHRQ01011752.1.p1 GENE.GHRQ01011752.1~~GHRQ01011752.1.p1  ORF type:complete len:300 (+),score=88.68 GHRQ01011752.1:98-997(+)
MLFSQRMTEHYCMPRYESDCAHPDNIGCSSRCILYVIITQHCVADAYNHTSGSFNASCEFCNMCWDRIGSSSLSARKVPYALLQARGETGALYNNHWLVLPKAACSGIESSSPGCTDAQGEYLWANAFSEALGVGFKFRNGAPDWAMMLNAPNRRGVHQMHIHIAHLDSQRTSPGVDPSRWLLRKLARQQQLSAVASAPSRVLGEGFYDASRFSSTPLRRPPRDWARAYAVWVPTSDPVRDLGVSRGGRGLCAGQALRACIGARCCCCCCCCSAPSSPSSWRGSCQQHLASPATATGCS